MRIGTTSALLAAVGTFALVGLTPSPATAVSSSIAPGSCVWETSAGVGSAIGPSALVVAGPDGSFISHAESDTACSATWTQPLTAYTPVTSPFGMRIHPITGVRTMHYGTDYARSGIRGAAIRSIGDGTVVAASESYATTGTGNTVVIAHAGNIRSQYMHMGAPTALRVGTTVEGGETLGYVGSTGAATGPHLHLEVRVNGTLVDAAAFLSNAPFLR